MPNGERILTKWNGQLASEEVLRNWVSLSDGAVNKFIQDNFNKKWDSYDTYGKGNIDESDAPHFMRDLFSSMAPPPKIEVNPYEVKTTAPVIDSAANKDSAQSSTTRRSITTGGQTIDDTPTGNSTIAVNKQEAPMPTPTPSALVN